MNTLVAIVALLNHPIHEGQRNSLVALRPRLSVPRAETCNVLQQATTAVALACNTSNDFGSGATQTCAVPFNSLRKRTSGVYADFQPSTRLVLSANIYGSGISAPAYSGNCAAEIQVAIPKRFAQRAMQVNRN